ncbi:MAG: hypothetical protein NTX53_03050 [candidate division WOR-3 bacterium]|nr:hypothetical protein [candidate division WOR-3 bacterium]
MRKRKAATSRGYELALSNGTATGAKYASHEEVARRFREGVDRCQAERAGLRRLLVGLGVDPTLHRRYVPFGQRLAKICRNHESATRENLVRGLLREWEMRLSYSGATPSQPDRDVLRRICESGFGIRMKDWERP